MKYYFHHKDIGCKIIPITVLILKNSFCKDVSDFFLKIQSDGYVFRGLNMKSTMNCCYCKTHKKMICSCGWEWGHHYGSDSKIMWELAELKQYDKKYK